ncbi:YhhA family cyclophane-containing RiPP [uncultured Enterovirga sp.]|uniref:YhhA family cyclophane-containing RiPP n=1 Tax=uncultured Enterovirga sp. TaxID=2026352 RepID=UPI0035C9EDE8
MEMGAEDPGCVARERDNEAPEELRLDSVTLDRLMAEVRNEDTVEAHAYNRMHNRHNR